MKRIHDVLGMAHTEIMAGAINDYQSLVRTYRQKLGDLSRIFRMNCNVLRALLNQV